MSSPSFANVLADAQRGDREALGAVLERYRPYLRMLAKRHLDSGLNHRLDASDIVQQTFVEAQKDIVGFRGRLEPQFTAWLRQILVHNVAHATQRHIKTQKRSIRREKSLDDSRKPGVLAKALVAADSSPSARAMRGEAAVRLAAAITRLTAHQAEAIRLRYLEGWRLDRIASQMERSEDAVAGLIKRGLRALRNTL